MGGEKIFFSPIYKMASSSNSVAPGFVWNLQKTQDVEQLIGILRRPDYQAYTQRIRELLASLERYTPDLYKKILSDPNYKDRIITSLESVIQRWRSRNPVISSEISDRGKFILFRDLATALQAEEWISVQDLINRLGFGDVVFDNLKTDMAFRRQSLRILLDRLSDWAEDRPWLNYQAQQRSDTEIEAFDDGMTQVYVLGDFRKDIEAPGVKSLRYTALMSDPRAIAAAEKTLGLEITGNKEMFLDNYRLHYYTSDCGDKHSEEDCQELMAKTADSKTCYDAFLRFFLGGSIRNGGGLTGYLAKYDRYDVIEAVFAEIDRRIQAPEQAAGGEGEFQADPGTRRLLYEDNMATTSFDIATEAITKGNIDQYQKYFQLATQLIHPIIPRVIGFWGRQEYGENMKHKLTALLKAGVNSGNFEILQMVIDNVKDQIQQGIFPPQFDTRYFNDTHINGIVSEQAAWKGDIEILDRLKGISRFSLGTAVDGAISSCNPEVIDYLEPDMDVVYFGVNGLLTSVAGLIPKVIAGNCFKLFELCVRKTDASPEIVSRANRSITGDLQFPPLIRGKILELYLEKYLYLHNPDTLRQYLRYIVTFAYTDRFETVMEYPEFRDLVQYPELLYYRLLLDAAAMGNEPQYNFHNRYKMNKFLIDNNYVKVGDLGAERGVISSNDAGGFRALVDYYIQQGKNINQKDFEGARSMALQERAKQARYMPNNARAKDNIVRIQADLGRPESLVV